MSIPKHPRHTTAARVATPESNAQLLRIGGRVMWGAGVAMARRLKGLCIKCGLVKASPPLHTCEGCLGDVGHAAVDAVVGAIFGVKTAGK